MTYDVCCNRSRAEFKKECTEFKIESGTDKVLFKI